MNNASRLFVFFVPNDIAIVCVIFSSQKSKAKALQSSFALDLTVGAGTRKWSYAFDASWSSCLEDEQLALLMPQGIRFISPTTEYLPKITVAYSSIAWSPSIQRKSRILLAARSNSIDVIDVITGSVVASHENIFGSDP